MEVTNPEKYRNELYRPGTAVIRGILEGYTPQFGFTSGTLMSYDPITGRDCAALIEVLPDGRFSAEIETEHPKTLVTRLGPGTIRNLYVEPGDTLMCRFVMSDLQNPQCRSGMKDWSRSRFMGRAAEYNMYRMIADRIVPAQDSVYGRTQERASGEGLPTNTRRGSPNVFAGRKIRCRLWRPVTK